ncbi:MAG: glycosyltransferase [Streptosporangiales bacterium]|nr:glycosyltransferase [Streptosporangiales bacterium]
MAHRPLRALVYGDVNLNLIDGSAIWLQGIVQVLDRLGCEVSLLLKSPVRTTRLLDPLMALPGVTVHRPYEERLLDGVTGTGMSPLQASRLLRLLDRQEPYDLIVLRGQRMVHQVVANGGMEGRLWPYLTDIPQSVPEMGETALTQLTEVAEASRVLLCQTEELRCFLEGSVPAACGKCLLLPPLVPEIGAEQPPQRRPPESRPVKLVYTGKYAPHWKTYEMTSLPALLRAGGVPAELHMVGDKIHTDRADPDYGRRMLQALRSAPGVVWHGGHSREDAMQLAASCDVGLSWRHPQLDASLELSTKVLEFGALGLPVVLNRTPMHEELLGVDYPLFVGDSPEGVGDPSGAVVETIATAVRSPQTYQLAADRCREAARRFTLDQAVERMRTHIDRVFPSARALAERSAPLRVGVAGHDLKFFSRLLDYLRALPGVEVRLDQWESLGSHDPVASRELLKWADVIVCEWCGPVAVWYSRHKRNDQRLIVRLHRFELYASWPSRVDIDAVDQVVCVSPHYARLTRERTGWPADKIVVVPNWVDAEAYDRSKLTGAQFHLGLIGITPSRKRPDLALDVLEELRRRDPRFHLFAKTKMTWDYWWMWNKAEEREHCDEMLARVQRSPMLRGAVVFDPFGPDVAAWLRRIGFVLSTSDDESFHLAPAEGMASGAVPVLRNWPGVETIYDTRWVHRDPAEMAEAIHAIVREGRWDDERALAKEQAREAYDLGRVGEMFTRLLTENLPPRSMLWGSEPDKMAPTT